MTVVCRDGSERPRVDCVQCPDGSWIPLVSSTRTYDGDYWPESECLELAGGGFAHNEDESIVLCHDGEYRHEEDCTLVGRDYYPDRLVVQCCECGDSLVNGSHNEDSRGDIWCDDCWPYRACDVCGRDYDTRDGGQCRRCVVDADRVQSYSTRSANNLRSEHRGPELLGIELEVEAVHGDEGNAIRWIRKHLPKDYCIFKEDGSLGEGGFEIVTRPDSFEVHRRYMTALLSDHPSRYVRSWNTVSDSSPSGRCGIHIHVNKRWLSGLQLGKMLVFLNDERNRRFICGLAGRTSSTWAKMKKKKLSDVNRYDERYVALNITERTAELRIFRGTVALKGFLKNLEFTRALVEYTAPSARSIHEATDWKAFAKWVPRKSYPVLHEYLCDKGYRCDRIQERSAPNE